MANQKKVKNPSRTKLLGLLRESAFDPRKPGPLKVIADNSSTEYLELRAVEMIQRAQTDAVDDLLTTDERYKECDSHLAQAISLLVLARARRQEARVTPTVS